MSQAPGARHGLTAGDTGRRLARLVALGAAGYGLWLFCAHMFHGAITADWPWLYRTGLALWADGLPAGDTLSWTYAGHPWVLYQWLFEAVTAPLYALLGPTASVVGVCLAGFGMYMLWPAWFLARRGISPWLTLAVGGLVLIPVSVNFGLRPMLASNLALLAQFALVTRLREGRAGALATGLGIGLVYILWANSHLGFTLGLASLGLFALADIRRGRQRLLVYGLLFAIAVLATGLNPYGWTLYAYIADLSMETAMNAHIHELQPPSLGNAYMAAGAVLVALYALVALETRRSLDWAGLLHVGLFTIATADTLRFVVWAGLFYVLAAAPAVQTFYEHCYGSQAEPSGRPTCSPRPMSATFLLAAITGALVLAGPASAWVHGAARQAGCEDRRAGIMALDRTLAAGAHWFSSERVGSCTHLYAPGRRVFIDTRFDMYPERFVLDWFEAYQHRRQWRRLFARWHITAALLARSAPLSATLSSDPDFIRRPASPHMWLFESRRPSAGPSNRPGMQPKE